MTWNRSRISPSHDSTVEMEDGSGDRARAQKSQLKVIQRTAAALQKVQDLGHQLRKVLKELSLNTGSSCSVLAIRSERSAWRTCHYGPASMINIGQGDFEPLSLLDEATLQALERGEQIHQASSADPSGSGWALIPLLNGKKLCGFLAFMSLKCDLSQELCDALRSVFELWFEGVNQRKFHEDIVDFLPQPTFIMNTNEEIVAWNKACEQMTGWNAEDIIGQPRHYSGLPFYGRPRPMVGNLIMYPDAQWEQFYHEYERDEDGDVVYSLAFCNALYNEGAFLRTKTAILYDLNQRMLGSIHTVRDITFERKMEESVNRSESMYRAITDFAGMGILLMQNSEIVYSNQQMKCFLKSENERITLSKLQSWITPEDRDKVWAYLIQGYDSNQTRQRFEFRSQQDNEVKHYRALAQRITYDGFPALHLICDDITEQKKIETKLFHNDRLTSLGTMAAGIAHELNQPMNTIRVLADGVLYGRDEGWEVDLDELYESMEVVSRQVMRMHQVIQNIRDFAREDGSSTWVDVDVNKALENVFSMFGCQLEAHGIAVHKHYDQELPLVRANLYQVEQLLMNLLVNARQALDAQGNRQKTIKVITSHDDGLIKIEISDNAIGIPMHKLEEIFVPFYTTKEPSEGTGLGLSICQSIVAALQGQIMAYNNELGGASFIILLQGAEYGYPAYR